METSPLPVPNPAAHLRQLLAENGGWLTTEQFMRDALYHPQFGYYSRHIRSVGAAGDFSTAATLHPALGQAVAAWARKWRRQLGWSGPLQLIEAGAGTGHMAQGVLSGLTFSEKLRLRYHIVEASPALEARQKKTLRQRCFRWHSSVAAALEATEGHALIFSNELPDAFPCARLALAPDRSWHEIGLALDADGQPTEELRPLDPATDPRAAALLATSACSPESTAALPVGQRVEIHLPYRQWLADALAPLRQGALLTIDYGSRLPELHTRRPAGTLRAYFHHQRIEGSEIFHRFGQQDITSDVNFTDLETWGAQLGLENSRLLTQREFLLEQLPGIDEKSVSDPALAFLLDPYGAGRAFKVLEQTRL